MATPHLPPQWSAPPNGADPDEDSYDRHMVMGLGMPRLIQATQWSREKRIAGRDLQDIHLSELTWDGLNNWGFRLMANGRYINVEITRSFKESAMIHEMLSTLRKRRSDGTTIDIDLVSHKFAEKHDMKFDTDTDKQAVYKALGGHLANSLAEFLPHAQAASKEAQMMEKLDKLLKDNETLRKQLADKEKGGKQTSIKDAFSRKQSKRDEPAIAMYRKGDKDTVFESNAPVDAKTISVNKFIKDIGLDKTQDAAYKSVLQDIKDIMKELPEAESAVLGSYIVEWGMPFDIAKGLKQDDTVKLIALAFHLTNE